MTAKNASLRRWKSSKIFEGLESFGDLEARVNQLVEEKDRGDVFEIFIEGYLATQSTTQCKQHWIVGSIPLALRERFKLPSDGTGIDGIYESSDGAYVAYQVKYRQKSHLSYAEVASFLGLTEMFNDRVVFTNASTLSSHATPRTRWVGREQFLSLSRTELDEITGWIVGTPVIRVRAEPDPRHQTQVLADIAETLTSNSRATVVMACGTGKTLVALWAVEQQLPKTVLVLLPSLSLVQQTLREWARHNNWGRRFSFICVCSDPTVARGEDLLELSSSDVGFRVDTDPSAVRDFLSGSGDDVRVVFSTYQSSDVVAKGVEGLPAFDIAVFDEAHKTTGLAGGQFSRALSDAHIPIKKRVFFTATPRHVDIHSRRDKDGEYTVQSMDDVAVFGPRAHTLSFKAAAEKGVICQYKVVISVVDKELVDDFARRNGITLVDGDEVDVGRVSNLVALQQAIAQTGATKVLTFHSRVSLASEFASHSPRGIGRFLDDFQVLHVNGKQRSADRAEIINMFTQSSKGIITNARCLTEGVDIPSVDMVAFIDPRKSRVDIAQAVGRAMRKPRGQAKKTVGYIFVPLFLGSKGESIDDAIKSERFDAVADVLNSLREHDDGLVDLLRDIRAAKKVATGGFNFASMKDQISVIGPRVNVDQVVRSISIAIADRITSPWYENFGVLRDWKASGGDVDFPRGDLIGGNVVSWLYRQRERHRKNLLPTEYVRELDGLGITWDLDEAKWEEMFDLYLRLTKANGLKNLPKRFKGNQAVANWGQTQRAAYKAGKMRSDRQRRLEEIGFDLDPLTNAWWSTYNDLVALCKGRRLGPATLESSAIRSQDRQRYAVWMGTQRQLFRNGALPGERIEALNRVSFSWNPRDDEWRELFERLCILVDQGMDPNIKRTRSGENGEVAGWLHSQRNRYRAGTLSVDKVKLLESIGVVWEPMDVNWERCFRELKELAAQGVEVNSIIPGPYSLAKKNKKCSIWLTVQRKLYKEGSLPPGRVEKLESIGVAWDTDSWLWRNRFNELRELAAAGGDVNLTRKKDFGRPTLAGWLVGQVYKFREGKLEDERFELLRSIGVRFE